MCVVLLAKYGHIPKESKPLQHPPLFPTSTHNQITAALHHLHVPAS